MSVVTERKYDLFKAQPLTFVEFYWSGTSFRLNGVSFTPEISRDHLSDLFGPQTPNPRIQKRGVVSETATPTPDERTND